MRSGSLVIAVKLVKQEIPDWAVGPHQWLGPLVSHAGLRSGGAWWWLAGGVHLSTSSFCLPANMALPSAPQEIPVVVPPPPSDPVPVSEPKRGWFSWLRLGLQLPNPGKYEEFSKEAAGTYHVLCLSILSQEGELPLFFYYSSSAILL